MSIKINHIASEEAHRIVKQLDLTEDEFVTLRDSIEEDIKEVLSEKEAKKEEIKKEIWETFLEVWDIPDQPFLEAVEAIMGQDYWDGRVITFQETLYGIEDRNVLLGILERMKELAKEE